MRFRLPLYAKILVWFFLNVVLLAAVFTFLFTAEFSFNLDWFLASGARARIEAVRDLIVGDLNSTPPDEWPQILERYSEAYHVKFRLLDDDGRQLIGDPAELPKEVRDRIEGRLPPRWRQPLQPGPALQRTDAPPVPAAPEVQGTPPQRFIPRWRPPFRALMHTNSPSQYWLMTSARIDNPQTDEMRVILVSRSSSVSGGGLIFDPKPWMWLAAGAIVFSLLFWLPLVRGITRFIGQTTQATRRIAGGRFDVRVKTRRLDELGELGEAINQMAKQLDNLVTGQKRFLGDIAHELCSPLAHLQMTLGILEQHAKGAEEKYVRSAVSKASQIASLVGELLSFSKASIGQSSVHLQPVSVQEAVEDAVGRELTEGADVRVDLADDLVVASDRDLLIRALANLLRNAIRHAGTAAPIYIRGERQEREVLIKVADAGPGVPEAELERIFDAFYRVDSSRNRETGGTGLGLSIVKMCVETCCGTVSARNVHPHGLEVVVRLPAAVEEAVGVESGMVEGG